MLCRRRNRCFSLIAGLLALLVVYGVVFRIAHVSSDIREDAARAAAIRKDEAAYISIHPSLPGCFFLAVPPPCPICEILAKITLPTALTSCSLSTVAVMIRQTIFVTADRMFPRIKCYGPLSRAPPRVS